MTPHFETLVSQIHQCNLCQNTLPHIANPIIQAHPNSQLLIIGQAPGLKAHQSSTPWNDKSGERLRSWLNIQDSEFYNPELVSIIPMAFCYPGRGKTGDLPPSKTCAPKWHEQLLSQMVHVKLTLLIGSYAQNYYQNKKQTMKERMMEWLTEPSSTIPLPHPSPRNNIWLKKNPWFTQDYLPEVNAKLSELNLNLTK